MRIPIIRTTGSHYQVGYQIGQAARASLSKIYMHTLNHYGSRWPALLGQCEAFLPATERCLPRVVEELRGCAEGAKIPFNALFLMSVEELLCEEVRGDGNSLSSCAPLAWSLNSSLDDDSSPREGQKRPGEKESAKGCSDLAAAPPATADGCVWLAHNNDLGRGAEEDLFVTYFCAEGEPEVLAVTVGGIFISIGFNRAGISLTGNQLSANDSRVGVPRLLVVRDILAQDNFDSAVQSAQRPERASSYNNLIASTDGRAVNVEGSATDCALLGLDGGTTFHTNHYLADKMKRFELLPDEVMYSAARCSRAQYYAEKYRGRIDRAVCERFLSDHVFAPWSVCKHAGESVTVFSALINLTAQEMWLARGNPCQNEYVPFGWSA